MTTKAFRELKNKIMEAEGNVRFSNKLLENLTEKQLKNLLNFYLSNVKLDSELKNQNVDMLEDAIASAIVGDEEDEDFQEPKKVALEKKSSNKKVKKVDAKNDTKKEVKNEVVIDINTLKRGDKILVIDEKDNHSIVEIRDVEPKHGILGRDTEDLSNCFSISAKELAQGFYIFNRKQYLVKPYRGWDSSPYFFIF